MIPPVATVSAAIKTPGYRVGNRYFPAATRLSPGQIYSSVVGKQQNLKGLATQAENTGYIIPAIGTQVRTPVSSAYQQVAHYKYHFWNNRGWYWRDMRWSLPEMEPAEVFNQMGQQLPGQPMIMQAAPRYTKVLNSPAYNTVPSGVVPTGTPTGSAVVAQGTSVVGRGAAAMSRRRFASSAPFKAVGPEFHGQY